MSNIGVLSIKAPYKTNSKGRRNTKSQIQSDALLTSLNVPIHMYFALPLRGQ